MKNPLEVLSERKGKAVIAAVASLAIVGCGHGQQSSPEAKDVRANQTAVPPDHKRQIDTYMHQMLHSLNTYRKSVWRKHQAEVFMGTCVAWPNSQNSLTVTLNPGISTAQTIWGEQKYTVFGAEEKSVPDSLQLMNGPDVGSEQVLTLVFRPKGIEGGLVRKLSEHTVHDKNGQRYYEDIQTGMPVLDTALVSGPTSTDFVSSVCDALRNHKPLPGNGTMLSS